MKKTVSALLIAVLCLLLASCAPKPLKPEVNIPQETQSAENSSGIKWLAEPDKAYEDIVALNYYNDASSPNSKYLAFKQDGKWGIINDKLEVIFEAKSDMEPSFCSLGHLHVTYYGYGPFEQTLPDGVVISDMGHDGNSLPQVVYNVADSTMYVVIFGVGDIYITPITEYTGHLPEIISFCHADISLNDNNGVGYDSDVSYKWIYGYCDGMGRILTNDTYEYAMDFSCGVAAVMRDNHWGYIDTSFKAVTGIVFQPCYGSAYYKGQQTSPFYAYSLVDGYAPVMSNTKYGVINNNGDEVLPCEYDKIVPLTGGRAIVKYEGKWGIADLK